VSNSNVVGDLEFSDGFEEIENSTGSTDLDKFGTFLIPSPPAESDMGDWVE
jgi:hypothetical protein